MYTSLLVAGPGNDVLESDDPSGESSPSPSSTPISLVRRRGECVCVGGGGGYVVCYSPVLIWQKLCEYARRVTDLSTGLTFDRLKTWLCFGCKSSHTCELTNHWGK